MKGAWRPEWLRWELLNWDALVSGCGWTLSQSGTSKEVMTVISGHDRHLWACIGMTGRLEPRVAVDWDSLWGCLWFVPLQEPLRRQWHHWGAYDRCGAAIAGTSLVSLACLGESSGIWTAVAGTSGMEWPWWEKQKGQPKEVCTYIQFVHIPPEAVPPDTNTASSSQGARRYTRLARPARCKDERRDGSVSRCSPQDAKLYERRQLEWSYKTSWNKTQKRTGLTFWFLPTSNWFFLAGIRLTTLNQLWDMICPRPSRRIGFSWRRTLRRSQHSVQEEMKDIW